MTCALAIVFACALSDVETLGSDIKIEDSLAYLQPLAIESEASEASAEPWSEQLPTQTFDVEEYMIDGWHWQMLPVGIIYHSYWAGPHEPRISIDSFHERSGRTLWDATVGGRGGVIRYGNNDPLRPQGFQWDVYGAAVSRLDVENSQDLDSTDYVFGFPWTYGVGNSQYKFGYAHVSSHLGDELAIREPDTLDERVNYVRDSLVLGMSHYPWPAMRVYAEAGWAFHLSGGAQPWEFQFGNEISRPGPTGFHGSPFFAINGRLREEHNYGGDLTTQTGWLWRGIDGKVFRIGVHYFNGKSSQFQFYDQSEEQIGMGLWYDF